MLPQSLWPVHCVQNSPGAQIASALDQQLITSTFHRSTDPEIDSYSAFYDNGHRKSTGLSEWLKEQGVTEVFVCGLAEDICVKFTALDAVQAGFPTSLVKDACRGVNLQPGDVHAAILEMQRAGVQIVNSKELLKSA